MKKLALLPLIPLACASLVFAQPPQQPSTTHVWRQSQKTNTADRYTYSRFILVGKFAPSRHGVGANRPALALDCIPGTGAHPVKGKFLAANLLVGTTLKIVYVEPDEAHGIAYFPKVVVHYQTEGAKDEEDKWSSATDKTSLSIPKDSLKKMLRARTVAITADDDHGSQVAMQFDMPDPTLVEDSCNVD